MKSSNDILRQASRYTMNGLIDPRLLEPADGVENNTLRKAVSFVIGRIAALKRKRAEASN